MGEPGHKGGVGCPTTHRMGARRVSWNRPVAPGARRRLPHATCWISCHLPPPIDKTPRSRYQENHIRFGDTSGEVLVRDCQTGASVSVATQLVRIINGRLVSQPYNCQP